MESLTEGTKQELLGLKKGRLLVRHAHFRTPLFGRFPRRACLDGIQGVEIFNAATANGPRDADGLWRALKAKMGDVTFNHKAHGEKQGCKACHATEPPAKFAIGGKDPAHKLCGGCHTEKKAGPAATKCMECHKKK